jgi:PAS domain S-box-containing protein
MGSASITLRFATVREEMVHPRLTKPPKAFVRCWVARKDLFDRISLSFANGTALVPVDGDTYGAVVMHLNITKRKQAEEAMRLSEERFSGAFEHAPIGVALQSPEGRYLKVNRAFCELVGYAEAELLALAFLTSLFPGILKLIWRTCERLAAEIRSYEIEKRYVHRRGHSRHGCGKCFAGPR